MSGQDSSSSRLPSDYSSELHKAVPALVDSSGSVRTEATPITSSSSEQGAPPQASPSQGRALIVAPQATAPEVPNAARPLRGAEAELNRRIADHDRGGRRNADRERSREHRDQVPHHSISTPANSRPSTPRRTAPVTPQTNNDRVSDLQGEVFELQRRLRHTEMHAHQHGQMVEQQASEGMAAVYLQEEVMRQRFEEWGRGASSEIDSLLNSFHASTIRGEQGEEMVANLEARLRYVEGAAAEVHGRHFELNQTTAQIRAAELRAASDAQMMQAHAHQEAMTAQHLRAEMRRVQTVTDELRGNLNHLEGQAELGEREREAVLARRAALDHEASQMRDGFVAREQQLIEVRRSLAESEARNAAESRELAVMLQECRALPRIMPPSPPSATRSPCPAPPLALPVLPPFSSVTREEHERILRAAIGPLESTINQLKVQYEDASRDKQSLAEEVNRLTELVDSMQDEASDSVRPLPVVGPCPALSRAEFDTAGLVEIVIHRLVSMGVFTPHGDDGRRAAARAEPGGDESFADSAESGAAEEPRATRTAAAPADRDGTAEESPATGTAAAPADGDAARKDRNSKRPTAVHVPKFPTVTQVPQWEKAVARALVASSVYDDKAEVKWFKRASLRGVSFEELGNVGDERFHALDALLCQALIKNLPPDLHQRIRRKEDEAWQNDTTITGLQVAWMIYDYFKTEDHMSQVYGLNDLTDLTWYGDNRMLDFLQQWDFILDHLEGDTLSTLHANGGKTLRDLLFRQVENPPLWLKTLRTTRG